MRRAIEDLEKTEVDKHQPEPALKRVAYMFLATMALDSGQYAEMSNFTQLSSAVRGEEETSPENWALELHFAYAASADARLASHDQKFEIRSASGGESVFPHSLPALESCKPNSGPDAHGWVFRAEAAEERFSHCFDVTALPSDAEASVLMRVDADTVVAAEAAGQKVDQASLACASRAVLNLPIPAPHDFNFVEWSWSAVRHQNSR
jgi:hypothetical protein